MLHTYREQRTDRETNYRGPSNRRTDGTSGSSGPIFFLRIEPYRRAGRTGTNNNSTGKKWTIKRIYWTLLHNSVQPCAVEYPTVFYHTVLHCRYYIEILAYHSNTIQYIKMQSIVKHYISMKCSTFYRPIFQ